MMFGASLLGVTPGRPDRPMGRHVSPRALRNYLQVTVNIYTEAWLATGEKENSAVAFDYRLNFQ